MSVFASDSWLFGFVILGLVWAEGRFFYRNSIDSLIQDENAMIAKIRVKWLRISLGMWVGISFLSRFCC
ncbi:hypothetical protein [Algoriphagus ratkowskyi]|uniref:Uncharacterized protein n=1 Tax=Algoriphagus ratkowskyi TaxID=57028 RepID=A0ABY3HM27_9BACT|nr:hypothetical protein [Algoriphagus ratkowskyi]TXD77306.1 hypothetical protein ESW18_13520 [Algoriphagus ratkowskyi]